MTKLVYLKGSKEMATQAGINIDSRLWNVLEPKLTDYVYTKDSGVPTLGLEGLRKTGLIS